MEVKQTAMGSVDYSDAHTAFLIASELFSFSAAAIISWSWGSLTSIRPHSKDVWIRASRF